MCQYALPAFLGRTSIDALCFHIQVLYLTNNIFSIYSYGYVSAFNCRCFSAFEKRMDVLNFKKQKLEPIYFYKIHILLMMM